MSRSKSESSNKIESGAKTDGNKRGGESEGVMARERAAVGGTENASTTTNESIKVVVESEKTDTGASESTTEMEGRGTVKIASEESVVVVTESAAVDVSEMVEAKERAALVVARLNAAMMQAGEKRVEGELTLASNGDALNADVSVAMAMTESADAVASKSGDMMVTKDATKETTAEVVSAITRRRRWRLEEAEGTSATTEMGNVKSGSGEKIVVQEEEEGKETENGGESATAIDSKTPKDEENVGVTVKGIVEAGVEAGAGAGAAEGVVEAGAGESVTRRRRKRGWDVGALPEASVPSSSPTSVIFVFCFLILIAACVACIHGIFTLMTYKFTNFNTTNLLI
jgi:hypothetical protein